MTKKHFIDMADRLVRLYFVMNDEYEWRQVKSEMTGFCHKHGTHFNNSTFEVYIEKGIANHKRYLEDLKVVDK